MLSAVIDNNVLISGILNKKGIPGRILDAAIREEFILITSEPLWEEFRRVSQKLSPKYPRIAQGSDKLLSFLLWHSIGNPPHFNPPVVRQDPDDDRLLECAQAAHADYVVSGNRHLRSVREFQGIPICNPKKFLDDLRRSP